MITSANEIQDSLAAKNIQRSILDVGSGELEMWKSMVIGNEQLFDQLFSLIFSDNHRLAWRACWIIDTASEDFPDLLANKIPTIIHGFSTTKDGSLKRHFTRILCRYQIPNEYLSAVIDRSFGLLAPSEPISVRVFAMQLLFNITKELPELKRELISVLEHLVEEGGSAGFINRSGRLLRQLRS
jgi:hypothetical protein